LYKERWTLCAGAMEYSGNEKIEETGSLFFFTCYVAAPWFRENIITDSQILIY